MNNLFPYNNYEEEKEKKNKNETINPMPVFKEFAWDFVSDKPVIENGEFKIVEKNDAIKIWVYKIVKTIRYKYIIFTSDYGVEILNFVGKKYTKGFTESEIIRDIREALLINPYIISVQKVDSFYKKDKLTLKIKLNTIYSILEVGVRV